MHHPKIGERVRVFPMSLQIPVQRGDGLFGQFLPAGGAEVLWDSFLHRRLHEGAIRWEPLAEQPAAAAAAPAAPEMPAKEPE